MLGAVALVAGGARNHAGWACLTGRRVAQNGDTPLHIASFVGNERVIEALLAAKADVHAKDDVRGGTVAWRARGVRRGGSVLLLWFQFSPERKPQPPNPQFVNSDIPTPIYQPHTLSIHRKDLSLKPQPWTSKS